MMSEIALWRDSGWRHRREQRQTGEPRGLRMTLHDGVVVFFCGEKVAEEVDASPEDERKRAGFHMPNPANQRETGRATSLATMAFGQYQSGTQPKQRIVAASSHLDGDRGIGCHRSVIAHRQVCKRSGD